MSSVRFRFKLVLVGEGAVGKTSIRQKYMGKGFTGEYLKTIGADFASKTVEMKEHTGESVKSIFQIWDLAGQVEFKEVRASFYGGCQGVLLVFDLTRKETMDQLKDWILEAAKNAGGSIKAFYLIGNKYDLPGREVTKEEGKKFANFLSERLKFSIPYIETSAKTGENIEYLFSTLCRTLLLKEGLDIPEIPPHEIGEQTPTAEAPSELIPPPIPPKVPPPQAKPSIMATPAPAPPPPIPEDISVPEIAEDISVPDIAIPEIDEPPSIPEIPSPSTFSESTQELEVRLEKLEARVAQLEEIIKKIAKIIQDSL